MGNLRSVEKAFVRLKLPVKISFNPDTIAHAERLILPGVGHFLKGMENLRLRGILEPLNYAAIHRGTPVLGICLGMQLMTKFSEEGFVSGLGWIDAETCRFNFHDMIPKIPHMGWNNLRLVNYSNLMEGITNEELFYFVHSYFVKCKYNNEVLAETIYGASFVSSFRLGHIYGCQFHPEKSQEAGLKILQNFIQKG